jgi:hypothetical protein
VAPPDGAVPARRLQAKRNGRRGLQQGSAGHDRASGVSRRAHAMPSRGAHNRVRASVGRASAGARARCQRHPDWSRPSARSEPSFGIELAYSLRSAPRRGVSRGFPPLERRPRDEPRRRLPALAEATIAAAALFGMTFSRGFGTGECGLKIEHGLRGPNDPKITRRAEAWSLDSR